MSFKAINSALSDLLVLDLTGARSGPTTARQFADWGATVIRIERPVDTDEGDLGKRHGPDFQNLHRNKRSLALDLKAPEGKAILLELVKKADVLLENFRPDVKHRLGIDFASLEPINPRLVYGSISGFGQDGPYAGRPGLDQIAQGMGGHMMVTGEPGRGPMRSGAAINDVFSGILLANGIMNALWERQRSGRGQWIHTSLVEAQIFMLDFQAARWTMERDLPGQEGAHHATLTPMGVFKTKDGYINIAPMPAGWPKFCAALGAPAMATDPDFATQDLRKKNRPRLTETINAITSQADSAHWIGIFNEAGVPCGPIYTLDQTFADPQVQHLGVAQTVYSEAMQRELTLVGQPLHMSRSETRIAAPAPECGAHTVEILHQLGYDDARIDDLEQRGVILTRRGR